MNENFSCFGEEARLWDEFIQDLGDVGVGVLGESSFASDGVEETGVLGSQVVEVELLESSDVGGWDFIKVASDTSVKDADLLLNWHWHVLLLF